LWKIADNRINGCYGEYDRHDPDDADWRAREANRYITELQRQRELRPVQISIYLAVLIGLLAITIAAMAIPTKDSLFNEITCRVFAINCKTTVPTATRPHFKLALGPVASARARRLG
jgi:hypothetical protein